MTASPLPIGLRMVLVSRLFWYKTRRRASYALAMKSDEADTYRFAPPSFSKFQDPPLDTSKNAGA